MIEVRGTQRDAEGREEEITLLTPGQHYVKNDTDYFIYRETSLSGMDGTTTAVKVRDGTVILVRTGAVEARQVFATGQPHFSTYITPFGTLNIGIMPLRVDVVRGDSGMTIELAYELKIGGKWLSTNNLRIAIREERKHGHQDDPE